MTTYETLLCEIDDGVALVTLNRPEVLNAFNPQMEADLAHLWQALQHDDDVRCVVLTGAGDRAFCVGIDRDATIGAADASDGHLGYSTPWVFDDPGKRVGPKANELWKPVIGAVRGMACGGAFYILGETDFIIAGRSATFFDPHVTYQMPAAYEPIHLLQKMPLQEVLRMALLGAARADGRSGPTRSASCPRWSTTTTSSPPRCGPLRPSPRPRRSSSRAPCAPSGWATRSRVRRRSSSARCTRGSGSTPRPCRPVKDFGSKQRIEWRLR